LVLDRPAVARLTLPADASHTSRRKRLRAIKTRASRYSTGGATDQPGADVMPEAELERLLAGARAVIENCVGVMPAHERFIERHCAAAAA
jgi:hypothetical protein